MSEISELELEKQLLENHISKMCSTDDVDTLKKLQEMAICRILNIYEFRLDEIILENAKKLSLADDTIIIRKDYNYMDQCASSYFRVPRECAAAISKQIDDDYMPQLYKGEEMEHLIAKELGIEFLKKVWESDAGPMCLYEPYERQQRQEEEQRVNRRKR